MAIIAALSSPSVASRGLPEGQITDKQTTGWVGKEPPGFRPFIAERTES